uniref:Uncharacterized protein n=1 Tax=Mus spicilegus TaxID=10103 RepID=A0A8C6GDL1_MUSSI
MPGMWEGLQTACAAQAISAIRASTLVTDPWHVRTVESRSSYLIQHQRILMSVRSVRKPLSVSPSSLTIREFIHTRSPAYAGSAEWLLFEVHNLLNITEFILVSNPMSVESVGRPLSVALRSLTTTKFIPTGVLNISGVLIQ